MPFRCGVKSSATMHRYSGRFGLSQLHSRVEEAVSGYVADNIVARSALSDIHELEEALNDNGLGTRLWQHEIQSDLQVLDSLLFSAKVKLNPPPHNLGMRAAIGGLPSQFKTAALTLDCSNHSDVFCKGWGVIPFFGLFFTLLAGLLAPLYTQGWSRWQPQMRSTNSGEDDSSNS